MNVTPLCPCCCHIIPDVVFKQLKKEGYDVANDSVKKLEENFREKRESFMGITRAIAPQGSGKAERFVYDSHGTGKMKVKLVRHEGDSASTDPDVNLAYDNGGIVKDFFKTQMGWNSIDGNALDLIFNVHYLVKYNNAFWDGEMMTFGDGDGVIFTSFAKSLDVTGHELAHGVVQYTAGLNYKGQSGAMNEHFADVFGISCKQWHFKQTAQTSDWLIGAEVLIGKFAGKAIRSFKAPGDTKIVLAAQPEDMTGIYKGTSDNGGVHTNSGILNKAFYLVSLEIGTQEAAKLWFEALKLLKPTSKFKDLYKALNSAAKALIPTAKVPANTPEVLRKAFIKVGIITKI
jgi:Zn-dependent metalloprotease